MPGGHARISGSSGSVNGMAPPDAPWREITHFEYEYADCWRQALILGAIRSFSDTVHFKYFGVLAWVNGSDRCALPFSCFQAPGWADVPAATEPGQVRPSGARPQPGDADAAGSAAISGSHASQQPPNPPATMWHPLRTRYCIRNDVTWVGSPGVRSPAAAAVTAVATRAWPGAPQRCHGCHSAYPRGSVLLQPCACDAAVPHPGCGR